MGSPKRNRQPVAAPRFALAIWLAAALSTVWKRLPRRRQDCGLAVTPALPLWDLPVPVWTPICPNRRWDFCSGPKPFFGCSQGKIMYLLRKGCPKKYPSPTSVNTKTKSQPMRGPFFQRRFYGLLTVTVRGEGDTRWRVLPKPYLGCVRVSLFRAKPSQTLIGKTRERKLGRKMDVF